MQAAWDLQKKHLTLIALNFSGVEKNKSFDISGLHKNFKSEQNYFSVYAEKQTDFNSPENKNKIKTDYGNVTQMKPNFEVNLKPYAANAWVFSVD